MATVGRRRRRRRLRLRASWSEEEVEVSGMRGRQGSVEREAEVLGR